MFTQIKQQIIKHAQLIPDEEVCGLIFRDRRRKILPCKNVAEDRKNTFTIDPDYFEEVSSKKKVIAIYHSHCLESQPSYLSSTDIANSKACGIPYLLYHTAFNEWDYYDPNNIYPYPLIPNSHSPKSLEFYLGWRFEYGRSDCYTLVRSYYKGMLDIELPDFPRNEIEETTSPNWDMFNQNVEIAGFRKLGHDEPLQDNDMLIMNIVGTQAHHAALLVNTNNNKALHILGEGRLSEIFMYGGYWVEKTRAVLRRI